MDAFNDNIKDADTLPSDDQQLEYLYDAFEEFITNEEVENENGQYELPLEPIKKVPDMSDLMKLALTDLKEETEPKNNFHEELKNGNELEPETRSCEEKKESKVIIKSRWNDIRNISKMNTAIRPPLRKAKSEGDALLQKLNKLSDVIPITEAKEEEKEEKEETKEVESEKIRENEKALSKTTKELLIRSRRLSDTIERNRSLYFK